jgi:N-acetylneuraminate synthase
MGNLDIAHRMIRVIGSFQHYGDFWKVDVVKFQKRTPRELLSPEEYDAPHPNPANSYGNTYGEHREFLELDMDAHRQLKKWCEEEGCVYSTSVWDLTAAKEMVSLAPQMLKIPSACNMDFELLRYLTDNYKGEIHVSFGMTTHAEEEKIVSFFEEKGRAGDLVVYACTSGYPVPLEDICLLEIPRLKERFGGRVKDIGFSGHHYGTSIDIAAYALGANYFERHFTLNKTWKGTDHIASLEPDEMKQLARNLHKMELAITRKKREVLDIEAVQRNKLKRKI